MQNQQIKTAAFFPCNISAVHCSLIDAFYTFCEWIGVELSEENNRQLWIPPGYAHGFCVLSDIVDFHYKCTTFYRPELEGGVRWDDESLAIDWPLESPILSSKDANLPLVRDTSRNLLP